MEQVSLSFELRELPSVTEILRDEAIVALGKRLELPHEIIKSSVNTVISELRARRRKKPKEPGIARKNLHKLIVEQVTARVEELAREKVRRVLNATGILIHTNLGRAPLGEELVLALSKDFEGYVNLEYELSRGERSRRGVFVESLLKELSSAEDALLVNNNAGAVFLILHDLCSKKEVLVSRGELVQIGGGFRIPEIMRVSTAKLVEVGTTNKTSLSDYEDALTGKTAAILKVHKSNFVQVGFVEEVGVDELVQLARKSAIFVFEDMGAGTLIRESLANRLRLNHPGKSIRLGVDLVCFSGDKILGLSQGGVILGKRALIERLRKSPIYRVLRPDKTLLKIMQAGLSMILDGRLQEVPFYRMLQTPGAELKKRGEAILRKLESFGVKAVILPTTSEIGGGFPGGEIESVGISISAECLAGAKGQASPPSLKEFTRKLRLLEIPIIAKVSKQMVVFDLRTILPEEDEILVRGILCALRG